MEFIKKYKLGLFIGVLVGLAFNYNSYAIVDYVLHVFIFAIIFAYVQKLWKVAKGHSMLKHTVNYMKILGVLILLTIITLISRIDIEYKPGVIYATNVFTKECKQVSSQKTLPWYYQRDARCSCFAHPKSKLHYYRSIHKMQIESCEELPEIKTLDIRWW